MSTATPAARKFVFRREKNSGAVNKAKNIKKTAETLFTECRIKNECGSCRFINSPYKTGLTEKFNSGISKLKEIEAFANTRFVDPVESPRNLAYKSVANLLVRKPERPGEKDRFTIGKKGQTGKIYDMGGCPLNEIAIGRFIRTLKFHLNQSPLEPWDEKSSSGSLAGVEIKASHITKEIMVTFHVSENCKLELKKLISLMRVDGHKINSAHMNILKDPAVTASKNFPTSTGSSGENNNNIIRIAGTDKLRDRFCDLNIETSSTSAFLSNPWQSINLLRRIEQFVGTSTNSSGRGWEINSSTGVLSMLLAKSGYKMTGIDTNSLNVQDATSNLKRNDLEGRVNFLQGDLTSSFDQLFGSVNSSKKDPDTVIINSPKGGLEKEALNLILNTLENSPKAKIFHVSSDLESLSSEVESLCGKSHMLSQIEAFDFKAQSDQLLWLSVITPK